MRTRHAFSLIELLVAIAIVAVLIGLILTGIQRARATAERLGCSSNLRQLGLACATYHDIHGMFPSGYVAWPDPDPTATRPGWGWGALLLPYLEQEGLAHSIDRNGSIADPRHAELVRGRFPIFVCPADHGVPESFSVLSRCQELVASMGPTSYAASWGAGELDEIPGPREGVFYRNSRIRIADITDGTSGTTLIGDRAWSHAMAPWAGAVHRGTLRPGPSNAWRGSGVWETAPHLCLAHNKTINDRFDDDGSLDDFFSHHVAGINMLFADGSVRFLRAGMDEQAFAAMGTRAGGEVIQDLTN